VRECLIWAKDRFVLGRQDYQWQHEPCLYGWSEGGSHAWYGDRKQTTILQFERPGQNKEHPTMKPVALFDYLIKNSTKQGDSARHIRRIRHHHRGSGAERPVRVLHGTGSAIL